MLGASRSRRPTAQRLGQLQAKPSVIRSGHPLLGHLALSGWGYADFHAVVNFTLTQFSEVGQELIGNSSLLASVVALCKLRRG